MKTQLTFLLLISSAMPFAFWEVEGPFTLEIDLTESRYRRYIDDSCNFPPSVVNKSNLLGPTDNIPRMNTFFYSSNTGYVLFNLPTTHPEKIIIPDKNEELKKLFLAKNPLEKSLEGWYTKRSVERMFSKFDKETHMDYCVKTNDYKAAIEAVKTYRANKKNPVREENDIQKLLKGQYLSVEKTFLTDSGIEIINEEGAVSIKKENQQEPFRQALTKYFENEINKGNLTNITSLIEDRISESPVKRLRNSNILAIYAVLKGDTGKNSIIFGITQNRTTHRKFFWITDIKDDISVLLKD